MHMRRNFGASGQVDVDRRSPLIIVRSLLVLVCFDLFPQLCDFEASAAVEGGYSTQIIGVSLVYCSFARGLCK